MPHRLASTRKTRLFRITRISGQRTGKLNLHAKRGCQLLQHRALRAIANKRTRHSQHAIRKHGRQSSQRLKQVALAFDFQRVPPLPTAPWDQSLDVLITNTTTSEFRPLETQPKWST